MPSTAFSKMSRNRTSARRNAASAVRRFMASFQASLTDEREQVVWREHLSAVLNDHLEGSVVVDLLPNEHRDAWVPTPARYTLVRPVLATRDGKPAGHAGKATKGRLARALLQSSDATRTLATFDAGELELSVE